MKRERRRGSSVLNLSIALLALLAVSVAGWCWLREKAVQAPERASIRQGTIATNVPARASVWVANARKKEEPQPSASTNEWDSPLYPGEKLVSSVTNSSDGYVIDVSQKPGGARTKHVRELPSIWESATDALIATVLQAKDGMEMPPLPPMGRSVEREFLDSLRKPISIGEADSDEVKAIKQVVISARDEIKSRIESGERFADILADHRELVNENGRIRMDALRELSEIRRTGTKTDVEVYVQAMNHMFGKMGIAPIGVKRKNGEEKSR